MMDRTKLAKQLDAISCTLDHLSRQIERMANDLDPKLATPRKPTKEPAE